MRQGNQREKEGTGRRERNRHKTGEQVFGIETVKGQEMERDRERWKGRQSQAR